MPQQLEHSKFQIPAKLYRIGELVRYTPFSRQTIHNYTTMGLIQEAQWTEGGHRLYDESVFERLSTIMELKKTRTLQEIRHILSEQQIPIPVRSNDLEHGKNRHHNGMDSPLRNN